MTHALAIDTTSDYLSLAVLRAGRPAASRYEPCGNRMARVIFSRVDEMLRGAGLTPAALDFLAVAHGPGSFTGTRIGMAVALTFSQVTGKPLLGVDSLRILAEQTDPRRAGRFHVLLNCARDEIYYAPYRRHEDGRLEPLAPIVLTSLALALAAAGGEPVVLRRFSASGPDPLPPGVERMPLTREFPDGELLLQAALTRFRERPAGPFPKVEPLYLKPDALRTWTPAHAAARPGH